MAADEQKQRQQLVERHQFNEQCFLIKNWKLFTRLNQKSTYETFGILTSGPGADEQPAMVLHSVSSILDVEEIMRIKPYQLNYLVPKIQIFKVDVDPITNEAIKETEIAFRDHTSPTSVDNILKGVQGRGDSVGLQSFEYTFGGTNEAEVDFARCTLKMFFQNVSSFVAREENGVAYMDLIVPDTRPNEPCEEAADIDELKERRFIIKVVAGWSDPIDPQNEIIDEKLLKAIQKSKTIMLLSMIGHQVDFNEDGSLVLSIDYQGHTEGYFSNDDTDFLYPTGYKTQAEEYWKIQKESLDKSKTSAEGPTPEKQEDIQHRKEVLDKNVEYSLLQSIGIEDLTPSQRKKKMALALEGLDRQIRYQRILEWLRASSNIYFANIPPEAIDGGISGEQESALSQAIEGKEISEEEARKYRQARRSGDLPQRIELIDQTNVPSSKSPGTIQAWRITPTDKMGKIGSLNNAMKTIEETENLTGGDSYFKINFREKSLEEKSDIINQKIAAIGETEITNTDKNCPDCRKIYFFFLGDLLDVMITNLGMNKKDFHILLGPAVFTDPSDPARTKLISINLADMPISLNLFNTWYLKHVVASNKSRYVFKSFLNDIIKKLVVPAMGADCYAGATVQNVTLGTHYITIPKPKEDPYWEGRRIGVKEFTEIYKSVQHKSYKDVKDVITLALIHASGIPIIYLTGNYEEDRKKGIYHFSIGADSGLLKSVSFSKVDTKYLKEARATSGTDRNKRLWERYNATIKMVGNTIFRPGSYIYIDTDSLNGWGSARKKCSVSRRLNIGGYYHIVKINHVVENGNYEVELDARWVSTALSDGEVREQIAHQAQKQGEREASLNSAYYKVEGILAKKKGLSAA